VTYLEALHILGLERDAEPKAVRKAYLRLIKQHSPERDPEGFKRVRAAYELAQSMSAFEVAINASATSEPASELALPLSAAIQVRPVTSTTEPAPAAEPEDESEELYRRWIDSLDDDASAEEVAAVARRALADGHTEFLSVLRTRGAAAMTSEELATWRASELAELTPEALDLALLYLERGAPLTTIELLDQMFHRYAKDPFVPRAPARSMVDLLLQLCELGLVGEAMRAYAAYETAYPLDERRLYDPTFSQALHELGRVHAQLDSAVVKAIAPALRSGDAGLADVPLRKVFNTNKAAAKAARIELERSSPVLFDLFGGALQEIEPNLGKWYRKLRIPGISMGAWIALMILRGLLLWHPTCGSGADRKVEDNRSPVAILCDSQRELCLLGNEWNNAPDCASTRNARARMENYVRRMDAHYQRPFTMKERIALARINTYTERVCEQETAKAGPH
jgi:tetratricopeptide (TPR) repeat protein